MQVLAASGDEHCVWYGQCPTKSKTLNCYYDGPAKTLDASAAEILTELCPMLNISLGKCVALWDDKLSTSLCSRVGYAVNAVYDSCIQLKGKFCNSQLCMQALVQSCQGLETG